MSDFLTAIPIAIVLVISTGPVFFVIIETSISKGIKHALGVSVGAAIADIVFVAFAFLGANTLLQKLKNTPELYFVGGVVLIVFGIISLTKTYKNKRHILYSSEKILHKGGFLYHAGKGFLLNIINMGTLLFWMGSVVFFGAKFQMDYVRLLTFFTYIIVIYMALDVIKIVLAKQLKNKLTPLLIYKLKQAVHVIIIFFGSLFILQGAFPEKKEQLKERFEQREKRGTERIRTAVQAFAELCLATRPRCH
jgi:threonine/homoserine/homoserine lactone efflux protein